MSRKKNISEIARQWLADKQGYMPYQAMDIQFPTPREKSVLPVLSMEQQKALLFFPGRKLLSNPGCTALISKDL